MKGPQKVLKPCDRLPFSQVESDDEALTEWFSPGDNDDDADLKCDSSS